MSQPAIPSELAKLAFLSDLAPEQIEPLAALATPVYWDEDTMIFRHGSPSMSLYLIREGRVAIELSGLSGKRVTILTVGPGEIFGWSNVFADQPKFSSARAVVATNAYAFDSLRLRALCDANPSLGYALTRRLLTVVSERLRTTRMQLLDLFASPEHHAKERP